MYYKFTSAHLSSLKSLISLFVLPDINVDYYSNTEMSLMTIDNNFFIQVSEILLVTYRTQKFDQHLYVITFAVHLFFSSGIFTLSRAEMRITQCF